MKNKKVIITLVVLVVAIGAYFGVRKLQQNLNRQAMDNSAVVKSEENKEDNDKESKKEEEKKQEVPQNTEKATEAKNEAPKQDAPNKETVKQSNTEQKQTQQNNNTQTQNSKTTKAPEKKANNFTVVDSVTGKSIVVGYISIQEGETVENATERFLRENGVSYKNKDGYISRIGDLKERDKGTNSGWCYYINGVKASLGMRGLTLKTSDKIEWRYVADGVNN